MDIEGNMEINSVDDDQACKSKDAKSVGYGNNNRIILKVKN